MKLLSVIIPKSNDSRFQEACKAELKGLDYEIISTVSWKDGLKHATGEYVCFMDDTAQLSEGYFWENLRIFTSQPSFRKLAVVGSAVRDLDHDVKVYGYILSLSGSKPKIFPSHLPSSSQPYTVQIAYIPGAIIRRSVLEDEKFGRDMVADSIRLSLRLWSEGSRLYLNPYTTYYDNSGRKIQYPFEFKGQLPDNTNQLISMFRREMVG